MSTRSTEETRTTLAGTASASTPLSSFLPVSISVTENQSRPGSSTSSTAAHASSATQSFSHHHRPQNQHFPLRPRTPDSIAYGSTTASVSTGADWPNTPTLTTAADISSPSTPVHEHAVAAVFQQHHLQQLQQLQQQQQSQPAQQDSTEGLDSLAPGSNPPQTSTGASTGAQTQTQVLAHSHQPSEQLKRNWLTAWIHSQPRPDSASGFISTDPSRSASPGIGSTGFGAQMATYPASNTLGSSVGSNDHTNHFIPPELDPTTPTLASMQQQHSVSNSGMPVGNYETAQRQSWTKDHPGQI